MASTTVSANYFNDALKQIASGIVWKDSFSATEAENDSYYFSIDHYMNSAKFLLSKYSKSYIITILNEHVDDTADEFRDFCNQMFSSSKVRDSFETMHSYVEHNSYYRMLFGLPSEETAEAYWVYPEGYYNTSRLVMQHCKFPIDPDDSKVILNSNEDFKKIKPAIYEDGILVEKGDVENGDYIYVKPSNSLFKVIEDSIVNQINGDNIDTFGNPYSSGCTEVKPITIPLHEWSYYDRTRYMETDAFKSFISSHTDSNYKYLNYLSSRRIYPFIARMADRFSLLYCPSSNPENLSTDFQDAYEKSRMYAIRVFYTDAYRNHQGVYYEGFIAMGILFMALNQMYYKYLDADIDRNFYDLESLKVVYEAYGVPFYDKIPIRYHKKIVKKINKLIRYKGCEKVILDLCDIFDYEILGIYQYYLVKERKYDENKIPITAWKPKTDNVGQVIYNGDGSPTYIHDYQRMYNFYFLKCNINDDPYQQMLSHNNYEDYEKIAVPDQYWLENSTDTIQTVEEMEYNLIETKYLGVQIMFSITELMYESSYFMRMLLDNRKKTESIYVHHDRYDMDVNLFDFIVYLFAMVCKKNGFEGTIPNEPSAVARIYGINYRGMFQKLKETTLSGLHIKKDFEKGDTFCEADRKILIDELIKSGYGRAARGPGIVISVDVNAVTVQYDNNEIEIFNLIDPVDGTHFETNLSVDVRFETGDIIIYSDDSHLVWKGDYILPNELTSWMTLNQWLQKSEAAKVVYLKILELLKKIDFETVSSAEDICPVYKAFRELMELLDDYICTTHDRHEFNAFSQLRRIIATTQMIDEIYEIEDDLGNRHTASTYDEFLKSINIDLYMHYEDLSGDSLTDELNFDLILLKKLCDELKYIEYVDSVDIDIITEYLYSLLRFFKSAKADLIDFNMMFKIDSRVENMIKLLDEINRGTQKVYIDDDISYMLYSDIIHYVLEKTTIQDRDFTFNFGDALELIKSKKEFIDAFRGSAQLHMYTNDEIKAFTPEEKIWESYYGYKEDEIYHPLIVQSQDSAGSEESMWIPNYWLEYNDAFIDRYKSDFRMLTNEIEDEYISRVKQKIDHNCTIVNSDTIINRQNDVTEFVCSRKVPSIIEFSYDTTDILDTKVPKMIESIEIIYAEEVPQDIHITFYLDNKDFLHITADDFAAGAIMKEAVVFNINKFFNIGSQIQIDCEHIGNGIARLQINYKETARTLFREVFQLYNTTHPDDPEFIPKIREEAFSYIIANDDLIPKSSKNTIADTNIFYDAIRLVSVK